jgi:WD40 repeat protein
VPQESGDDAPPKGAVMRLGTTRLRDFSFLLSAAVSADGKIIAIPENTGIRVSEVATGKTIRKIQCTAQIKNPIVISADGRVMAAALPSGLVVWDLETGKTLSSSSAKEDASHIAASADGSRIAVAMGGGAKSASPYVWDTKAGKELWRGPENIDYAGKIALSADGKRFAFLSTRTAVAIAGEKRKLEVWDIDGAKRICAVQPKLAATGIALSHDGRRLAAITATTVEIWNVDRDEVEERLANPRVPLLFAVFSEDGKRLAGLSNTGQVLVWNLGVKLPAGIKMTTASRHDRLLHRGLGIRFSAGGTLLACGLEGIAPVVWEPESGAVRSTMAGHCGPVTAMQFALDGKSLISASSDAQVITWNVTTGKSDRDVRLGPPIDDIRSKLPIAAPLALSQSGRFAALNLAKDGTYVMSLPENKQVFWLPAANSSANPPMAFSPDGAYFGCGDEGGGMTVSATKDGREIVDVADANRTIIRAAFSPDNKHLAIIDKAAPNVPGLTQPARVRLLSLPSGKLVTAVADIETGAVAPFLTFSGDGSLLVVAHPAAIQVFKMPTGALLGDLVKTRIVGLSPAAAAAPVFSPDSRLLATAIGTPSTFVDGQPSVQPGAIGHRVQLLEIASGRPRHELAMLGPLPGVMAFSPDGRWLATASRDTSIVLWPLRESVDPKQPLPAMNLVWLDLNSREGRTVEQALNAMTASGDRAVEFIEKNLKPATTRKAPAKKIADLIAKLEDDDPGTRERATQELVELGSLAEPALRKAMAARIGPEALRRARQIVQRIDSASPALANLQAIRAVEALERIASPAARTLLEAFSHGDDEAPLTLHARSALARLGGKYATQK